MKTNWLAQSVGVFYDDKYSVQDIFEMIEDSFPKELLLRGTLSPIGEGLITLKDGSQIDILPSSHDYRGRKYDMCFCTPNVTKQELEYYISPYCLSNRVYTLNDAVDLQLKIRFYPNEQKESEQ